MCPLGLVTLHSYASGRSANYNTLETGNVNLASRASKPHTIMLLRSWNIALVCDQNRDHWAGTKQRSVAL